jgi:hypothetical protein
MADTSAIVDAIAAVGLDVPGIKVVYSAGGGTVAGVQELPDDLGEGPLPAFLLLDGDVPVIPGSWERQTWKMSGSIWVEYMPRGERYRQLLDFREPVLAAFRAKSKGGLADPAVQAVLLLEFGQVEGRQWQRGETAPTYLVLPFELEAKVNRAVTYLPA